MCLEHFHKKHKMPQKSIKSQQLNQCSCRMVESPLPPGGSSQKSKNASSAHALHGGPSKLLGDFWNFLETRKQREIWIMQGTGFMYYATKSVSF